MSVRKGNKVIAGGNSITIDSAISATSPNPVQNKAVAEALENVAERDIDCGVMS